MRNTEQKTRTPGENAAWKRPGRARLLRAGGRGRRLPCSRFKLEYHIDLIVELNGRLLVSFLRGYRRSICGFHHSHHRTRLIIRDMVTNAVNRPQFAVKTGCQRLRLMNRVINGGFALYRRPVAPRPAIPNESRSDPPSARRPAAN